MAKMRYIKPEILTDEKTVLLSDSALKLFIGLLLHSDDSGVHPYSLISIKAEIFPLDRKTTKKIEQLLDELFKKELIEHYAVDNHKYLLIKNFTRHQIIPSTRSSFRHPLPNGIIPKKINKSSVYQKESSVEAVPEQCQDTDEAVQEQWHNTIKDKELILNNKILKVREDNARATAPASPEMFNFKTTKFSAKIKQEYLDELVKNFEGVDVFYELGKMNQWYSDHPMAQITHKTFRSKVRKWMSTTREEVAAVG